MPHGFPDLTCFPETIAGKHGRALRRRACARSSCVKCGGGTIVGYSDIGRLWPTCLPCARYAAATPCPNCGDHSPVKASHWTVPAPEDGGHAAAHFVTEHESGARCRPLNVNATFRLPCSSCGAEMRFRVLAGTARYLSGSAKELRCAGCGQRWRLAGERRGINVYIAGAA